jgi:hypothetical protein
MPDSLQAPAGYVFSHLLVWSNASTVTTPEALTVVARVAPLRDVLDPPKEYDSSATASYNTSFYFSTKGATAPQSANIPGPFPFHFRTEKLWFKASGATAHWSWCAYCVPAPGWGATNATIFNASDTHVHTTTVSPGLTQ